MGQMGIRLAALLSLALLIAPDARALAVAGFGDSLTTQPSYLDFLPADSRIDLGVDGETTADGVIRLQAWLATNDTDVLVVFEGTNDVFRSPFSQATTVANLDAMVVAGQSDGARVILVAPPPIIAAGRDLEDARVAALAPELMGVASARGAEFVDLYALFAAQADLASLYQADGLHPNHTLGDPLISGALSAALVPEPTVAALLGGAGILLGVSRLRRHAAPR
jgi:lysophospholipase L1-like esterase